MKKAGTVQKDKEITQISKEDKSGVTATEAICEPQEEKPRKVERLVIHAIPSEEKPRKVERLVIHAIPSEEKPRKVERLVIHTVHLREKENCNEC